MATSPLLAVYLQTTDFNHPDQTSATIAVANKLGRIVWAVWTRDVAFDPHPVRREAA
jgi:hypothetical protein